MRACECREAGHSFKHLFSRQLAKMAEAEAIDADLILGKNARGQDVKGLGYLDMLKERGKARSLLDSSLKKRGYTYEEVNYV